MIRQKILQQLLEWIECNLEHPISIEDIAQKSGYSRRNIQLLFRNFMHVPLGEYIRKRRLCRAAILVRLTAKSMLDIALSLHFDSQQSFSREFKKLFGCSPRVYRHRDYWDLANIFPSFLIRQQQKTECRLVNFPETPIFGNSFKYDIEVSNKSPDEEVKLRRHHLARCMNNFKTDIYFVSTFEPSTKS
ncbi:helix-turn-helix domain-containing protein, partial [Escherichia coli]|nr:helix-turn-helix domain-containing protein [Escherichia coli]